MLIVGAGLVGCELANDLTLGGHAVTLLNSLLRLPMSPAFELSRGRQAAKPAGERQVLKGRTSPRHLYGPTLCGRSSIACIGRACRLDKQQMRLFFSDGAMLNTLWNDEQFARAERDVALAHADGDATLENKEEIIGVVVRMPNELAFDLDDHEVVTIELTDHAWQPVTFKRSELVSEID